MMKAKALSLLMFAAALLLSVSHAHAQGDEHQVTEIRYIGLNSINPRDLESLLPFSPGDVWQEKFEAGAERQIKDYYAKRGFFAATVKIYYTNPTNDRKRITLNVNVNEGPPCLIESFDIEDPPGFSSKYQRARFKHNMFKVAQISNGDRYDEQWIAEKTRKLKEWLVSQDFILADTDSVQLKFNNDYTSVKMMLKVAYGDRVSFGFQNNTVFSRGELNDMITKLRASDLSRDYVGMIQRKFVDEYRGKARNNVKIEVKIRDKVQEKAQEKIQDKIDEKENQKHVTYIFSEGLESKIQKIQWEGLSVENAKRAKEIFEANSSRFLQHGYYVEKDMDNAITAVIEDLKSRGFLFAKLVGRSIKQVPSQIREYDFMRVSIHIFEGELTQVGELKLSGFKYLSEPKLKEVLSVESGKAFNPFALEDGLQKLVSTYQAQGYLDFQVKTPEDDVVLFVDGNRLANITLEVEENQRYKIDQVQIEGLTLTKRYVVERELLFKSDDYWLREKIEDTETALKQLGIFSEIRFHSEPSSKGSEYKNMVISLKDADPGTFEAGPGFRSDLGLRAFSRVTYNNFFGKNWIGILSGEVNRRIDNQYRFIEYKLDASVIEPRLFSTKNLFSAAISTRKQRFPPDFNASTTQFIAGLERKFLKIFTAKISYKLERIRQFDVIINGINSAIDNQTLVIGSFVPSITVDTRDSPFTTTKGQLSTFSLEFADPGFSLQDKYDQNSVGYYRWTGTSHWYFSLTKDIVWSNVFGGGFERSNIAGKAIPLIKLFRLGGYSSIRGFREETINVDNFSIKGTLSFLNLRTQFDLPFIGDLKLAPFLDAGNLFIDRLHGNPFFRTGAGLGFHYMTPIGPINLDYGVNLRPKKDENSGQVHFSVGFI